VHGYGVVSWVPPLVTEDLRQASPLRSSLPQEATVHDLPGSHGCVTEIVIRRSDTVNPSAYSLKGGRLAPPESRLDLVLVSLPLEFSSPRIDEVKYVVQIQGQV
jgi:hypothetical protein